MRSGGASLPDGAFVALTVRRLFYRNGLDTLLDAAVELRDRDRVHLVIGGSGPERDEIEDRIRREGLHNVRVVGFIPDDDLPDYYRAADVFLLPTRTAEGFGLVLMEAAAAASPRQPTPARQAIIDDGATGVLVPADSPRPRGRDRTPVRAPELLTAMSRAAYAKSSEFTWDRSIDILERVLGEAVASASGS